MSSIRPRAWTDLQAVDLISELHSPPDVYRPVPWLAWTGELDWPVLEGQLTTMLDQGITEFFLFPIYGMELPYMSAAYWERVGQTLDFCRQNGMRCWIYDDYNWPSGTCAGQVLRDFPGSREKNLCLLLPGFTPQDADLPESIGELSASGDVSWGIAIRDHVGINVKGCDWLSAIPGYLDVLSPEANRHFIEYTHERYFRQARQMFPDTIPGFFTDEPAVHTRAGNGWFGLPFTDDLFDSFADRYGYDLRTRLADLAVDRPGAARTRCHYWRWIAERFGEASGQQQRDWCDRHGVALTGHALGEETLIGQVGFYGDMWELLRHYTIPGIDLLANADGFNHPYRISFGADRDRRGYHLTCKYVHGVVRHSGGREMMSEAFGVCDWGMNLARQKYGFHYQVALGVTLFNDNSLITSIADFRKYAIAGKHFTQPWWAHYRQYADYNARLAALHAEGEPVAEVAVLFPRSTVWAATDAQAFSGPGWARTPTDHPLGKLQEQLYDLLDEMIRRQWHFDMLFEPPLATATVDRAELVTEHARYRVLVLPSARFLPEACAEVVRQFAQAGGIVIVAGDASQADAVTGADLSAQVEAMLAGECAHQTNATGREVCEVLEQHLQRPLTITGDGTREFVSSWRKLAGSDVLFVANMADTPADVTLTCALEPPIVICDPDTLDCFRPPTADDGGSFTWHFEPWQGYLVLSGQTASATCEQRQCPPAPAWLQPVRVEVLDGQWDFSPEPANMLRLSCQVRPDPDNCGAALGWQHDHGEAGWTTPDDDVLPEPIEPAQSPWYWLRAKVVCEAGAEPTRLVVDNPDFLEVYVNGLPAAQAAGAPLWAEENLHFNVSGLFAEGDNYVHVRTRTSKYSDPRIRAMATIDQLLQPLVLLGDFAAEDDGMISAWTGTVLSDRLWEEQGLPHFAGVGVYSRAIRASGQERMLLHLPACDDAVQVCVNGEACGVRAWHPYLFDLSAHLKPGENHVEIRVHNTLGHIITATYGGQSAPPPTSGLTSPPRLLVV